MKLPAMLSRRVSLRILFCAVTIVCIVLAVYVVPALKQKRAVSEIRARGGVVEYDIYQFDPTVGVRYDKPLEPCVPPWLINLVGIDFFHSAVAINLTTRPTSFDAESINVIKGCPRIKLLVLFEEQVTDDLLKTVAQFHKLEILNFRRARNLSDQGVEHLRGHPCLRSVTIYGGRISVSSFPVFASMPQLEELDIRNDLIGDDGMEALEQCETLRSLTIFSDLIGDDGIDALEQCKNLRSLTIRSKNLGTSGIAKLSKFKRLEELDIYSSEMSADSLRSLAEMTNLRRLGVPVDRETKEWLKQQLPNCDVY